jgi:hypothetical protein
LSLLSDCPDAQDADDGERAARVEAVDAFLSVLCKALPTMHVQGEGLSRTRQMMAGVRCSEGVASRCYYLDQAVASRCVCVAYLLPAARSRLPVRVCDRPGAHSSAPGRHHARCAGRDIDPPPAAGEAVADHKRDIIRGRRPKRAPAAFQRACLRRRTSQSGSAVCIIGAE